MVAGKRIEDIATLARNPLFSALSMQDLGVLLDILEQITVLPDVPIVDEGQDADGAYFVLDGEARVARGARSLPSLKAGDHFGELALVSSRPALACVRSRTPMRLARLSRSRYRSLPTTHPGLALHLAQSLASLLADTIASAADDEGPPSRERPASPKEVTVRCADTVVRARAGAPLHEFLPRPTTGRIVGGLLDNRPVSLETPVVCDASVAPILLATPEGREIFGRSVGLLVLEAAAQVAPQARFQWGPTLGPAQVMHVEAAASFDLGALAHDIDRAVRTLIEQDVPFREVLWTVEEARHHFLREGWEDAAVQLQLRKEPFVTLVSCGTVVAPSMGPVVRSSGEIGHVRLLPHAQGLLVDLEEHLGEAAPGRHHDTRIDPIMQEHATPRFGGEMASAQRTWLASLGVTSVGRYNEACVSGRVSELVRVSEGFHEKRIGQIADTIASKRDSLKVIRIAGPSSSGKTTFIKRLTVQLEINGMHPLNLSLDDYYVDREQTPRDERGEYDFESIEAIDRELLREQINDLLAGRSIKLARFDFLTGRSLPNGGSEQALSAGDVLVVEGLHGLRPELLMESVPREQSFGIFIHPATTVPLDRLNGVATEDVRLLRRIVRDRHGRGYSAAENIVRWPSVRLGEQVHVFPCAPFADVVFDSSLVYELSVLKVFAERYLLEVPQSHAAFPTALRLRTLVDHFVAIHAEHVPPTSMLREFIGGSGFEY